ncbi:MAG TPA: glycosyltransferase family 2 protein [Acidimicrobiales bacterium]
MPPAVMVSILAYRSAATSERALGSALALVHDGPLEVVVREQGGDQDEFTRLRSIADGVGPGVGVSHGPNLGFAGGHNTAVRSSGAEIVVVLNADAWLDSDFLRDVIPAFADPSVAAVQPKVLRHDGDQPTGTIDSAGLVPLRSRRVIGRGQGEPDGPAFDLPTEVFGPDGAVAVYRREALEDVALPFGPEGAPEYFDEDFFAYKEDVDLAWRLRLRGWRTLYVPSARAWHLRTGRETSGQGWWALRHERRHLPPGTERGFVNHRLLQLKDERAGALLRDIGPFASREALAWAFRLRHPAQAAESARAIARLAPRMREKRRLIQGRRVPGDPVRPWIVPDRQVRTSR